MSAKKNGRLLDWFPLPIYSKSLTDNEWLEEIVIRMGVARVYENAKNYKGGEEYSSERPLNVFKSLIINHERGETELTETPSVNFWPVRMPTPFESLFMAQEFSGGEYDEAKLWAKRLYKEKIKWIGAFHRDGVREKLHKSKRAASLDENGNVEQPYYNEIIGKCTSVWIDLDHDDETLKIAFSVWLAGARDNLKEEAKQPIGKKELTRWTRFKLLEAFDLVTWSQVNELNYTDTYIAKKLWPDFSDETDFVNVTERYRKVTKPMVSKIFDWNFIQRFWNQIELSKALELLVEEQKVERKLD